jgi:alpha-beta hydrolase superfamily lysophospholipase
MRLFRVLLRLIPLVVIVALVIAFGVIPYTFARQMAAALTHPERLPITSTPTTLGFTNWQTVRVDTLDGITLEGWFIPPPLTAVDGTPSDGAAILYLHALGKNRQSMLLQAALLYRQGFGALLIDQRAHGESGGERSTLGYQELADTSALIDFLLTQPEVNPKKIGIVGEGMGAVLGILSASHRPDDVRAVVAQSPYASIEDLIRPEAQREQGLLALTAVPLTRMVLEQETGADFYAVNPLAQIYWIHPRAVMLLHGDADRLVAPESSQALYDAARDPRELVFFVSGGHGGLLESDPSLWGRRVTAFLRRYLRDAPLETGAS